MDDPSKNTDPGPGPGGFYDVGRLAARLGVKNATLRSARRRGVSWLPPSDGELNNGPVWHVDRLATIEEEHPGTGRPRAKTDAEAEDRDA